MRDGVVPGGSVLVSEAAAVITLEPDADYRLGAMYQESVVGNASTSVASHAEERAAEAQFPEDSTIAQAIEAPPAALCVEELQLPGEPETDVDHRDSERELHRDSSEAKYVNPSAERPSHPTLEEFLAVGVGHLAQDRVLDVERLNDCAFAGEIADEPADGGVDSTEEKVETVFQTGVNPLSEGVDEAVDDLYLVENLPQPTGAPFEGEGTGGGYDADEARENEWLGGDQPLEPAAPEPELLLDQPSTGIEMSKCAGDESFAGTEVTPADDGFGSGGEDDARSEPATEGDAVQAAATGRTTSIYRPRLNRASARRAPAASLSGAVDFQRLEADLQISFGPGDWGMEVWVLLRQPTDALDEVAILQDNEETWLNPLDDQLLEPLPMADAAAAFGEPLVFTAAELPVRWSRTSRDLHVLAPRAGVAGFVSTARVVIGQENAVICRDALVSEAIVQILATGSPGPIKIEGPGVPTGWTCWRGVRPVHPSVPTGRSEILHALDPLPAVRVELTGGLQLARGVWLAGHGPVIRMLGMLSEGEPVLIDSKIALADDDGKWSADGWDHVGSHRIEHGGVSASYSIDPGMAEWEWWPAWRGATPLAGALAHPDGGDYFHYGSSATLIGASPGEICRVVSNASGISSARPGFDPVWLLTGGSGRRRMTATLIGEPLPPGAAIGGAAAVESWAFAISASRSVEVGGNPDRLSWGRYLASARSCRRRRR